MQRKAGAGGCSVGKGTAGEGGGADEVTIAPAGCGQRGKEADRGKRKKKGGELFFIQLRQIPSWALQAPKKGLGESHVQAQCGCSFPHSWVSANLIPYQGCIRERGKAAGRHRPPGRAPVPPGRCGGGGSAGSGARRYEGSLWWLSQDGVYSFPSRVYVT